MEDQVLLVDKELGWTSFDVVKRLRGGLNIKKIGHAGTLDPLATGLLILCTGQKTKSIAQFQALPKTYQGTLFLGGTTPSYDAETLPQELVSIDHLTDDAIKKAFNSFIGTFEQVPPAFSAVKVKGKRAYTYARENKKVELKPRKVTIYDLKITAVLLPSVTFEMRCSKGTYVRSLAHDIGKKLGVGAYLSSLRRTFIGSFSIEKAFTVAQLLERKSVKPDRS